MLTEDQRQELRTKVLEAVNDYLDEIGVDYYFSETEDWNQLKSQIGQTLNDVKYLIGVNDEEE